MKTVTQTLLFLTLTCLCFNAARAQFLGGFFDQQARQRKLMGEQIAQYELYLGAIKTGYKISKAGLTTAHELKNGTFNLHNAYFTSLEQVSPVIQNDPKGKAIADLNQQSQKTLANEISWQQQQKLLTGPEISYLIKVQANLDTRCRQDMDELSQLLTPGRFKLNDAQRLARLDKLYDSAKDKFAFAGSFTARCHKLALARKENRQDKDGTKKLYGIQ